MHLQHRAVDVARCRGRQEDNRLGDLFRFGHPAEREGPAQPFGHLPIDPLFPGSERQRQRHCQGGCNFGSLAGQLVESDPATRGDLADGFERWLSLFQEGLEAMKGSGELTSDANPRTLALTLVTSVQGGMLLAQTLRITEPLEAAFNAALAQVASFATNPAEAAQALRLTAR